MAILLVIPATRRRLHSLADWLARKLDLDKQWQNFLDASEDLLDVKVLGLAFTITALAYVLMVIVLDLALRGVGANIAYHRLFLALVIPTMLGHLMPVPAGIGVTEASMVGFLSSTTQIGPNTATAAVAIYRISAIVWQALFGAIIYFLAWSGEEEEADEDASAASNTQPAERI